MSLIKPECINISGLPALPFEQRSCLPALSAIYFVLDGQHNIVYIGRTYSLRKRWQQHHRFRTLSKESSLSIAWLIVTDIDALPDLEKACIVYFQPSANKSTHTRGPRPRGYINVHFCLPPDLLEWAKRQPEGFAGLVRALLRTEHARRTTTG